MCKKTSFFYFALFIFEAGAGKWGPAWERWAFFQLSSLKTTYMDVNMHAWAFLWGEKWELYLGGGFWGEGLKSEGKDVFPFLRESSISIFAVRFCNVFLLLYLFFVEGSTYVHVCLAQEAGLGGWKDG
jgi:hypothetical protein